jgi:hypothetical protein
VSSNWYFCWNDSGRVEERMGGSIAVGSLLRFYVIHFASARRFPHGWVGLAFSFPDFLFLLCSHQARNVSKSAV